MKRFDRRIIALTDYCMELVVDVLSEIGCPVNEEMLATYPLITQVPSRYFYDLPQFLCDSVGVSCKCLSVDHYISASLLDIACDICSYMHPTRYKFKKGEERELFIKDFINRHEEVE